MAQIVPPKYVRQVLMRLQTHGFPAYLVGGCVRDTLMNTHPNDWDICTAATPEQIMGVFPHSRPTGIRHGTVTVSIHSHAVEVTTFRADGNYSDHRHPDLVRFVGDLTADLARRDFTMNAIALSAEGVLVDPFGGAADIQKRVIRCVGEPRERFEEDALRMLRCLRFAARLGFSVDGATLAAIGECAPLAATLAAERVRDEVQKTLLTASPETLFLFSDLGLLDSYLDKRMQEQLSLCRIAGLPRRTPERWAALCRLLEQQGCIVSPGIFLSALRLDHRTIRICRETCRILREPLPESPKEWKQCLRVSGVESATVAARVADALLSGGNTRALRAVLRSGECFSLSHLAVSGNDLAALGFQGRAVGEMLDFLLDYVIEYPENNKRELLLLLAGTTEE